MRLKVLTVSATTFKVVGAAAYIKPVYDLATNTGPNGPFATRIPVVANDLVALGVGPRTGAETMPFCFSSGLNNEVSRVRLLTDDAPGAALALPVGCRAHVPLSRERQRRARHDLDREPGDETQDGCTMDATTHGSCATAGGGARAPFPIPARRRRSWRPSGSRRPASRPRRADRACARSEPATDDGDLHAHRGGHDALHRDPAASRPQGRRALRLPDAPQSQRASLHASPHAARPLHPCRPGRREPLRLRRADRRHPPEARQLPARWRSDRERTQRPTRQRKLRIVK